MLIFKLFQLTIVTAALQVPSKLDTTDLVSCLTANGPLFERAIKDIVIVLPKLKTSPTECSRILYADQVVRKLFKDEKKTLLIVNPLLSSIPIDASNIQGYILAFCYSEQFAAILEFLSQNQLINRRAYFIILALSRDRQSEDDQAIAEKLAAVIYKFSIIKAVLLVNDTKEENTINLYNFQYFRNKSCRISPHKSARKVYTCKNGKYVKNNPRYNLNIPKYFKSCEVNVVYLDIPPYVIDLVDGHHLAKPEFTTHGLEVGILTNIFAFMNITLKFIKGPGLGNVYKNHTVTGSLKYLIENKADIAIGGYVLTSSRLKMFECGYPYYFGSVAWAVPHQHVPVQVIDIMNLTHCEVWLMILILISTVTSIIVILASRYENEFSEYTRFANTLLNVAIVTNNLPINLLPKSHGVRLVFSMLLCFAFVYSAAYTTFLTSIFTNGARYEEKYKNLEDVITNKLAVYTCPNGERFFRSNKSLSYKLMKEAKLCQVDQYHRCLTEVAVHQNASLLGQNSFLSYIKNNYVSETRGQLIHLLPVDASYQVTFMMAKGFWGFDRVNKLIADAFASGLALKWMEFQNIPSSSKIVNSSFETVLSFENTAHLFSLALGGYLLAFIVFVIELLVDKYQKMPRLEYLP